jgi:hypothetical protein
MKVTGYAIQQGEYNGNHYHNVVFHGLIDANRDNAVGSLTETAKVKYADALVILGIKEADLKSVVGMGLIFMHDKYGKVIDIEVQKKSA